MKIIQHTNNCLELGSQDHYTVKVALGFCLTSLAFGILLHVLGFNTAVIFIAGSLILIFGGVTVNFEMNCQFDRNLNLFNLNYRNLVRSKKIDRVLSDVSDVRLAQDTDIDGYTFYYLVIMMKSGEEISIPRLLRTAWDIKECEMIVTEIKTFIHNSNLDYLPQG